MQKKTAAGPGEADKALCRLAVLSGVHARDCGRCINSMGMR